MDTEVITLMTNRAAADNPCLVMASLMLRITTETTASPGLKKSNMAGTAMKKENSGINTQVLFRKNHRLILEKEDNIKTKR